MIPARSTEEVGAIRPILAPAIDARTHAHTPEQERDAAYTRSYRVIRLTVGVLGILLPLILILGDAFARPDDLHLLGSLSAYYHSPMQDVFVGALSVVGFMLATYMAGEPRTWDFRASVVAGIALLGVVYFPTGRGLPPGEPACTLSPVPPHCSFVAHAFGERPTEIVHGICAGIFVLGMAAMSYLFARAEITRGPGGEPTLRSKRLYRTHATCALLIVAAGVWAVVGTWLHADLGELTPLYVGEVVAVWTFGVSWLLAGLAVSAPHRAAADPSVNRA